MKLKKILETIKNEKILIAYLKIEEFKDLIITTLFDDVEPEFATDEAGKFWHEFKLPN